MMKIKQGHRAPRPDHHGRQRGGHSGQDRRAVHRARLQHRQPDGADITDEHDVSRITIVTHGPPAVIDQIHAQLERLVPVHKVTDLTEQGPYVARELALIKVAGKGENRVEALRLAEVFRAAWSIPPPKASCSS
jgi:hypothetical protein